MCALLRPFAMGPKTTTPRPPYVAPEVAPTVRIRASEATSGGMPSPTIMCACLPRREARLLRTMLPPTAGLPQGSKLVTTFETKSRCCLFCPLLLFEPPLADDGALDGAVPDHFRAVVRGHPERVEAPIGLFQHRFALYGRSDARGRA